MQKSKFAVSSLALLRNEFLFLEKDELNRVKFSDHCGDLKQTITKAILRSVEINRELFAYKLSLINSESTGNWLL